MNYSDSISGDELMSNALKAIKNYIPSRIEQVKKQKLSGDKNTPQYQLNVAFNSGYTKALEDLQIFIKALLV